MPTSISSEVLKEQLKKTFGFSQFRGEQEAIIRNTIDGRNSFVLMPTGAGKSLCYQLPAIVMPGTAIVISPLIALMKNQVDQMLAFGINAQFLNSSLSRAEINRVKAEVISGSVKLLYIAPESLNKQENLNFLQQANISFVAIDEAHCISEWGHDFRPEYRKIRNIIESIDAKLPIIALTATATPKVQQDIQKTLNLEDATVFKSSFNRKNLYYEIRSKKDIDKQLIRYIKSHTGKAGIIYCLSRKRVEEVSELLGVNGIKALPYHAGLDPQIRMSNQEAFLNEEVEVMVATIAFGMGIDKPDVRFVIHYDAPKSLEGYYQETGRAGRDGLDGTCILFYTYDDILKLDKFNKDKAVSEKENAKILLSEMVYYANLGVCRRKQLLSYFGEHMADNCGFCDNCMHPTATYKAEQEVSLVLEAVKQTGEKFDAEHIADVLEGKTNQYTQSYEHEKLSVFGKGKTISWAISDEDEDDDEDDDDTDGEEQAPKKQKLRKKKKEVNPEDEKSPWISFIKQVLIYDLLTKDIENYGVLHLSEKGEAFLKDSHPLTFSRDHDYEQEAITAENDEENAAIGAKAYDDALFEILKNLRKKVAKEKNLPPYVIFQDPSLEEMATTYPTTQEEMAQINGVGMGKVVKFGKQFLDVIIRYVEENEIETAKEVVVKSTVNKSKIKIYIIQQVDRKIDLDLIAEQKELSMTELIEEIETICYSGTKLNLDYFINQVIEPDKQEEIFDYFMSADTDNIAQALDECNIEDVSEEELRLMRIKFLSELAN
ncbi:RecQ family ATP-dependent DNA helicase [Aquirufa regiilacus]|uniref:ATP-dependent DNA helicase RecQ n=1 Tax=Aquirufa regiilacus TaxID=3024868 RepID=A0ABU3TSF1_9BACT|nr:MULTISPECIES: RecQ family ATP-dependent DNA helicase [unclassified Aquirufa]MDT8886471.1 RecQ family ATP-dependent DNA helicase [Aquirufa sp. LEPPI-3A]MDU0808801.1 RecQ family ATP-dependent DNA helicase [Aquirufa sp. LEOWEIH-7C]